MKSLSYPSTDPHLNMAMDEFVLEGLRLDEPVFVLWQNAPSVIIGLSQNAFAEVNLPYLEEHGIALARRVTGGGAVYHDLGNLNYTIAGRSRDLERDYPAYVTMVADALRRLGVPAEVSGRNDILVEGRKCSGYAKRVWKDRLMIHGTLMYDVDLEVLTSALAVPGSKLSSAGVTSVRSRVANLKEFLPGLPDIGAFRAALGEILSCGDGPITLTAGQLDAVRRDADEKFRTWEWIYGRSPRGEFSVRKKFACGTVEATFSVDHGLIRGLSFGGDYLGNMPADGLASRLEGVRADRESLTKACEGCERYFDGMSPEDLAGLINNRL